MSLSRTNRLLAIAVSAAALAAGGLAAAAAQAAPGDGTGTNVLIAGLDDRAHLSRHERRVLGVGNRGCGCTDVLMLAHLSADGRRLSVLSMPRDLYVDFAPHSDGAGKRATVHAGKINSAYAHGGPDLTVRTVERATGVHIDHYLETRFDGFARVVDDLGGATVCTAAPLHDPYSKLDLSPGTHRLDGTHAVRYVRTRHVDPPGDLPRMRRQQRILADAVRRILDGGSLDSLRGRTELVTRLLKSVRTDRRTGVTDMVDLAYAARNVSLKTTEFATVPIADVNYFTRKWGSAVKWDRQRVAPLLQAMREDRPFTPSDRRNPSVRSDGEGRATSGSELLCPR